METDDDKPNLGGRPPIEIDWEKLKALDGLHVTYEEIAVVMHCSVETVKRWARDVPDFRTWLENAQANGRLSKRRAYRAAERRIENGDVKAGDAALLIFSSKQPIKAGGLGWSDKIDQNVTLTLADIARIAAAAKETAQAGDFGGEFDSGDDAELPEIEGAGSEE